VVIELRPTQFWRAAFTPLRCFALLLGALVGGLYIVGTSIAMPSHARWVFSASCNLLVSLAALAFLLLLLSVLPWLQQRFPEISRLFRRTALFFGMMLLAAIATVLFYEGGYQPLKFHYLIHRVESAQTSQEERAAFELAARWGHVWELNRLTKREWLPERVQHLKGDWILELEWLEGPSWSGKPFRAYRVVLDEKNLEVTYPKKDKK
jgi:hypothetical protein